MTNTMEWKKGSKSSEGKSYTRPATLKEVLAIPIVKKYIKGLLTTARKEERSSFKKMVEGQIIGQDEDDMGVDDELNVISLAKNELRDEQRTRLAHLIQEMEKK
jgi:hypothetical protein